MVKAFVAVAVTVTEPPKLTDELFIEIDEFDNWAFVTVPDKLAVGIVVEAVMADVPLPYT